MATTSTTAQLSTFECNSFLPVQTEEEVDHWRKHGSTRCSKQTPHVHGMTGVVYTPDLDCAWCCDYLSQHGVAVQRPPHRRICKNCEKDYISMP